MQINKLEINPAHNPAVLDTATWDPAAAWEIVKAPGHTYWQSVKQVSALDRPLPSTEQVTPQLASCTNWQGSTFCLTSLADGQQVLLEFGPSKGRSVLGEAMGVLPADQSGEAQVTVYRADLDTIAAYVGHIYPGKAPQVMGAEPRMGIGSRMTTASWPGVYRAMAEKGFAANAIQNSVREANVLEDLLAGRPAELNYGPNLGNFASGHAGSSFEGLWLHGVLEALKSEGSFRYGADADHMQVKRGEGKLEQAKRVLESVRHYTFYTMDVSDVLNYQALNAGAPAALEYLEQQIPEAQERREVLAYHGQPQQIAGQTVELSETLIGRFVGKYWPALAAMQALTDHVSSLKGGRPFDLEFAVDEVPAGVRACDDITSHEELLFIMRECQRRGLSITHVAPNVGVEKEMDYRCADGLSGFEKRVHFQTEMAREFGLMLDFHSGDDLSAETRRSIGRATQGYNQFKVSPYLQLLFAETLEDVQPDIFRQWWDDTLAFARREAANGSPLATQGLELYQAGDKSEPSARHMVFRHYCFASLGRRDEAGQYVYREMFYDLSPDFQREYTDRLVRYLGEVAADLRLSPEGS